jgi:hypothetical protein
MTAKAAADIAAVLAVYDFGRFTTLADIAGGQGHLLTAVLEATHAHGTLFELPRVIDGIHSRHERVTLQPGDFFTDPLPAAQAYLLMDVLHDWPDEQAAAILTAVRRAAPPGATLLIIEAILPETDVDPRAATVDVIMLNLTGGRERTSRQFADLLHAAGFHLETVIDTAGPIRIAEATAVP